MSTGDQVSEGVANSVLVVSCGELLESFQAELDRATDLVVVDTLSDAMNAFRAASHDLVVCGLDDIGWQLTPLFRLAASAQVPVLPVSRSADAFEAVDVARWAVDRSHVGAVVEAARKILEGEVTDHAELEQLLPASSLRVKAKKKAKKGLIGRRGARGREEPRAVNAVAEPVGPSIPASTAPASAVVKSRAQWPPTERLPARFDSNAGPDGRAADLEAKLAQLREELTAEFRRLQEEKEAGGFEDLHRRIDSVAKALRKELVELDERHQAALDASREREAELRAQLETVRRSLVTLHEHHEEQLVAAREREAELRAQLTSTQESLSTLAQAPRPTGDEQKRVEELARRVTKQLELSYSKHELLVDEVKALKSTNRSRLSDIEALVAAVKEQQQGLLERLSHGAVAPAKAGGKRAQARGTSSAMQRPSLPPPVVPEAEPMAATDESPIEGPEDLRQQLQKSLSRLAAEWSPKEGEDE